VKLRNTIEKQREAPKQDEASTTTRVQITEFQHSLECLSAKYETLSTEEGAAKKELQKLSSRLLELTAKVDRIDDALEQLQQHSYQYNVKIVGIPQQEVKESAYGTSLLCVDLFKKIGADVNLQDIHGQKWRTASGRACGLMFS
jgi:seryl-tRNA synthetase